MENKCWMCDCELDEDEVQYCTHCELQMMTDILAEVESGERLQS